MFSSLVFLECLNKENEICEVLTGKWERSMSTIGPQGRDHLEDQGVDGRSILKWILRHEYIDEI
jgi:hypothetical protein